MTSPAHIRAVRELCGLTHGEMARRLGVPEKTLISWETAARQPRESITDELREITASFDALIDRIVASGDDPIIVPKQAEQDGWPARSWRHAAALAVAERPADIAFELDDYVDTKTSQYWRAHGGAPCKWHDLAEWGRAHMRDMHAGVFVTQTGRIVGTAFRTTGEHSTWHADPETAQRYKLGRTVADHARRRIGQAEGEPVILVKAWEITTGQGG